MDKLLRPKVLETDPNTVNADKLYKHWKMTFENYIEDNITAVTPGTPGDEVSLRVEQETIARNNRKKHRALINNISADIYELVSECTEYDSAIAVLDSTYIRPTNVVYSRHKLITCKQDSKSIDTFKQDLERVAKSCNFQAVTAEENKNQYIRDAFINGLSSPAIRQRLLENVGDLSLHDAFSQARALEQAQTQSSAYDSTSSVAAISELTPAQVVNETDSDPLAAAGKRNFARHNKDNNNNKNTGKCWFCGNDRHSREDCPAKGDHCKSCQKPGHWARVCNSKSSRTTLPLGAIGRSPPDPTLA